MEASEFSGQISNIVSRKIVKTEIETPLIDGDYCAFYATQAAEKYFNNTVLSPETRETMYQERGVINTILTENPGNLGFGEAATFALVLPRLKEQGIFPTALVTSSDKSDAIEKILQDLDVSIGDVSQNDGEGGVGLELPALMISAKNGSLDQTHIWFCEDEAAYGREMSNPYHTKENPDLQAAISLAKKTTIIP